LDGGWSLLQNLYQKAEHAQRVVGVQVIEVFDNTPENLKGGYILNWKNNEVVTDCRAGILIQDQSSTVMI
jgi:hypothetical protein